MRNALGTLFAGVLTLALLAPVTELAAAELTALNNIAFTSLKVGTRSNLPDLVVEGITSGEHFWTPGKSYPVSLRVAGVGPSGTTAGVSTVKIFVSTDRTLSANDALVGSARIESLPAGSQSDQTTNVTLPTTSALGTYLYVIAKADADGAVTEERETNNENRFVILVGAPATNGVDLAAEKLLSPRHTVGTDGGTWTVTVRGYNLGKEVSSSPTTVRFFLSDDTLFSPNDQLLTEAPIAGMAPGSYRDVSASITIPSAIPAGFSWLLAVIGDGTAADFQRWNNDMPE